MVIQCAVSNFQILLCNLISGQVTGCPTKDLLLKTKMSELITTRKPTL